MDKVCSVCGRPIADVPGWHEFGGVIVCSDCFPPAEMVTMPKAEADALRAVAEAAGDYATPVAGTIETIDRLDRLKATLAALDRVRAGGTDEVAG